MTRSGSFALAPLLAAALLAPAAPRGEDRPAPPAAAPGEPARTTEEAPPSKPDEPAPKAPADDDAARPHAQDTWVDVGHTFLERKLLAPIVAIDRFFSDERSVETDRPSSFLRWRSEVRFAEDARRPAFTTGVTATLRLPSLDARLRRLRIVIAGETRDAIQRLFPSTTTPSQGGPPTDTTDEEAIGNADAGLRFYLWNTLASHADLGAGALLQLPPGVYGRVRLRWAFPVGPLFATRVALVGFWRSDVHFGAQPSIELDRPIGSRLLLRLGGGGTVSQESHGFEWGTDLAAIVPLPPRAAAQIGVASSGATRAFTWVSDAATGVSRAIQQPQPYRTRVYARLRRDMYRRWFFIEIEPEVAWPWAPDRGRYSAWGLMLRAEVQFHGKEAPPPPPPPEPPEPKDPEPAATPG